MPFTEGTFCKRWLKVAIWNGYTWRLEGLTQDEESVTEIWRLMHDDNTGDQVQGENSSRRRRNEEAEDEGRGRTRQRLEGSDEMNSRRSAGREGHEEGREGHEEGRDRGAGHAGMKKGVKGMKKRVIVEPGIGEQDRTTEPRGSSVAPEGRDLGLV